MIHIDNGWVSIHRKITEKGYYKDSEYIHLWVHFLLKANHRDSEFLFNGSIHKLKRGQFISGYFQLSQETGIAKSKIERIIKCFESEKQIKKQSNNKFSIYTILNYDLYQVSEKQNKKPVRSQREASEKQVRTNNNVNNVNNVNNINNNNLFDFEKFWTEYPKKTGKKKCLDIFLKKKPDIDICLETLDWQKKSRSWLEGYIPNPETWLNQERWNDEPVEIKKVGVYNPFSKNEKI